LALEPKPWRHKTFILRGGGGGGGAKLQYFTDRKEKCSDHICLKTKVGTDQTVVLKNMFDHAV